MRALDRKLLRDLNRLWPMVLAIALVVAGGVTALLMSIGSYRSLDETRAGYYELYRFADIFASVRRAPNTLADQIARIAGVAAVDTRIVKLALLDIPNFAEPATGQLISLPPSDHATLNEIYLRTGRVPQPDEPMEVMVNDGFAKAHGFRAGDTFSAILNGRKRQLTIVGTALSPEFIYSVGPGDIMPDNRRFAVLWMAENTLASAYDLKGAFSAVYIKLFRGASEEDVIKQLDRLLARYGGTAAYGRKDQTSHAWLDHELDMLNNMSRTLPPIFLLVTAFLVNLTLTRLVALEREQIGLLKAVGYSNFSIAAHYIKFVTIIVIIGILIGSIAGTWLGMFITRLFADYFAFPFLVFIKDYDIYVLGAVLSIAAGVVGAVRALKEVVGLAPAVAMQPPAPARFRHFLPGERPLGKVLSQPTMMMLRSIGRHPIRALFTVLGMALASAILIVSLFTRDTTEQLIDVTYFLADRQDATLTFLERQPREQTIFDVARLPGVIAVEPYREVPVIMRKGHIERRLVISGRPRDADLSRIIDVDLRPVPPPETGVAISAMLAKVLGVRAGDEVEIDLLESDRRTVTLPVAALVEDYFGLRAMMDADALSRLLRESKVLNSVNLSVDQRQLNQLYATVKELPSVAGMALQRVSLANFREAIAVLIRTMGGIYTALAAVIAFGVVYNSARIALSERARELASLRVLGFTEREVLRILLLELGLLVLIAQPPGWAMGYGLAWFMQKNLAGELMRVRLAIEGGTYVLATAVVLVAALLSASIVRRRVQRLDLVAVLKTRD